MSAVKRLIMINRIQNKSFVYKIYVCVLCLFIMYKYTHAVYFLKIFTCIYIYIIIFYIIYKYI